jgi:hypothetical protein
VEFVFRKDGGNVDNDVTFFNGDDVFGHHLVNAEAVVHRHGLLAFVQDIDEADLLEVPKHTDDLAAGDGRYVPNVLISDGGVYLVEILGNVDGSDVVRYDVRYGRDVFYNGVFNGGSILSALSI